MSGINYILDEQGNPKEVDNILEWARWFETADRIVAKTKVGKFDVSTVFLGIDHSFGQGPPLLYETMIFGSGMDGEYQERYPTKMKALSGHERAVRHAKKLEGAKE